MFVRHLIFMSMVLWLIASPLTAQVLDKQAQLDRQTFWDNRDWDWYKQNIPFFECPDESLTTTYYYRWELLTKHLTYGSPNSGYSFTEFIDRPFWSGAYGAISCPAGHQLYEARWLRTPVVANDYSRYWLRTPGAQPRNYSTWLADSVLAVDAVHPNGALLFDLLPDLVKNYEGWEARHFVPEVGLFWQTGHDDGMEFNINSRQTKDILRGAPSYRPSFNAYMWADAIAIADIARRAGTNDIAATYQAKAGALKKTMQEKLWDPRRSFFFPMFRDDEERDGHQVRKLTLTYETGQFAGSDHGRELIGYVPWQFNMLDKDKGYEQAWKYLTDPAFFAAEYGPTTVERHDPMFLLQKSCCWWSGQSWPYATTQTLKALANVLQDDAYLSGKMKLPVNNADYVKLLQTFSKSHRKEGRPYLAEALHPDTGSFEGHDAYNHSQHYLHSAFCDLVITGLVGLQPGSSSELKIIPLAPAEWDYFALDDVMYHEHRVSIVWDRTGERYIKGKGLFVFADGKLLHTEPTLKPVTVRLPSSTTAPPFDPTSPVAVNFAVNNDGDYYPRITTSFNQSGTSPSKLIDGNYWYHEHPPNRWTSLGSPNESDWIEIDLGMDRPVTSIKLFFLDDGPQLRPPQSCSVMMDVNGQWTSLPAAVMSHETPTGRTANTITLKSPVTLRKLKLSLTHTEGSKSGLTEIEVWGDAIRPVKSVRAPEGNLAYRAEGADYPKLTASHTSRFDNVNFANDGRIVYTPVPNNRWTSYESPNNSDWLELNFGTEKQVSRVILHIFDDGGGVQAPKSMQVQWLQNGEWKDASNASANPAQPSGGNANVISFDSVSTEKLRVLFTHKSPARSGVTEIEAWEK